MSRLQKGESGNPQGRPVGSGLQARLRAAVGEGFDELVRTVLDAAAGDMAAASLLLSRLVPSIKSIQEAKAFPLEGTTLTDKALSVVNTVAAGALSASDGKLLLDGLAGDLQGGCVRELLQQRIDENGSSEQRCYKSAYR